MEVVDFCKIYFNGFQDISNYEKNDAKTNVLAALKILSYFTVVIPLGFASVYGAASLYGRVSKKQELSELELQTTKISSKIIAKCENSEIISVKLFVNSECFVLDTKENIKEQVELIISNTDKVNLACAMVFELKTDKFDLDGFKFSKSDGVECDRVSIKGASLERVNEYIKSLGLEDNTKS